MFGKKPIVCFIDNELAEIQRFSKNLENDFMIGAGTTLDDALNDLHLKGFKKPDLFILDMYFSLGTTITDEGLNEIHEARKVFLQANSEYREILARHGESHIGGFKLAKKLRETHDPYIFLTRKAMLEEALEALNDGALKVIKKPDPNKTTIENAKNLLDAYDNAFEEHAPKIAEEIKNTIKETKWWRRKVFVGIGGAIIGFFIGGITQMVFSLIQITPLIKF